MFSDEDCQRLCVHLGLSPEATALIAQIRAAPPSRRVRSGAGNVCVRYPSRKMGLTIQAESHRVELAALYAMDFDPATLAFYDQPPPITLRYHAKSGRAVTVHHTPDFFVLQADGVGWDEWKPEEQLLRLTLAMPERYVPDGAGRWRCPPGEQFAATFGLRYRLRSSAEINWTLQRNLIFLEDYFRLATPPVPPPLAILLQATAAATPGLSLVQLYAALPELSRDLILTALATGVLAVDLSAHLLTLPEHVLLFPHQAALEAFRHDAHPHPLAPRPLPPDLRSGQTLSWDGVTWTVANCGATTITLLAPPDRLQTLSHATIADLLAAGALVLADPLLVPALTDEARARLAAARPEDWTIANQRFAIIQPLLTGTTPTTPTPPARTVRAWLARYRHAEQLCGSGYVGLLPQHTRRGNRTPRLQLDVRALIDRVITTYYETPNQPSMRVAYGRCVQQCAEHHLSPPSYAAFVRAIRRRPAREQTAHRQGTRAAYAHQPFHWTVGWHTPPHGDRPFEIGHIDHTELDIELVCATTGQALGRPWATFLLDATSRLLLAAILTFDPPSYRSCLLVLRACVRHHERLPQLVVVDGGQEFASIYFETLLARYGCTKKTRPGAEPRFGAVIERLFNTTNTAFVHTLQGNTQLTRAPRLVTAAVNPERRACWSLDRLGHHLHRWADEVYAQTVHPALGQTPAAAFAQGLLQHGERLHRRIPYDQDFYLSTLPTTRRGMARIQPNRGVKIHYLTYWADAFRDPAVQGTTVPVRYDPFDAATAYAFVGGRWVRCISEHYHHFRGRTEREITLASVELRARRQQHAAQRTLTAARLAAFLSSVEAEQTLLLQRLRDQQVRASEDLLLVAPESRTTAPAAPAPPPTPPPSANSSPDVARLPLSDAIYEEY